MTPNHHIPHLHNFILGVQVITIIPKLDLAKVKYRYQFQKEIFLKLQSSFSLSWTQKYDRNIPKIH